LVREVEPPSSSPTGHNHEQLALVDPAWSWEDGADTSLQPQNSKKVEHIGIPVWFHKCSCKGRDRKQKQLLD